MKLTNITLSDTAAYVSMYEQGYGYHNVPHEDVADVVLKDDKFVCVTPTVSPYIGHGWFALKLNSIKMDSDLKVNLEHFTTTYTSNEPLSNVCVLFTYRRSAKCLPCDPPPPTYIGWCILTE